MYEKSNCPGCQVHRSRFPDEIGINYFAILRPAFQMADRSFEPVESPSAVSPSAASSGSSGSEPKGL